MESNIKPNDNDDRDDNSLSGNASSRSRGRPKRPMAQKSVHELVLNLTQNQSNSYSEKKCQNFTQNMNKKHKTTQNAAELTTATTPTTVNTTDATTDGGVSALSVGQRVEACDSIGDWYSAKIVAFSEDNSRVKLHFERWSARYDQWFDSNSALIREKTETTTDGNDANDRPAFQLNEEVLARWTDNRPYPATIVEVYAQQKSVLVLFFDGYRKKVKWSQIEKIGDNFVGARVPLISNNKEFRVKDDHNDYKCHFDDCTKGFRKQSLLSQHLKHYHKSDEKCIKKTTNEDILTTTSTTIVTTPTTPEVITKSSRLKRKYVRKPMPTSAVRKSKRKGMTSSTLVTNNATDITSAKANNRREGQQSVAISGQTTTTTTTTTAEQTNTGVTPIATTSSCAVLATPVVKETPIVTPNTTLPFWDARTVMEIHESDEIDELVHCICDAREEMGLMVQCEICLCWQHANCMNFSAELDVPKTGYFCESCRHPKDVRKSQSNRYKVNHFIKFAKRTRFPFDDSRDDTRDDSQTIVETTAKREKEDKNDVDMLSNTNALLSALLSSHEVLTSLNTRLDLKSDSETIETIGKQNQISDNLSKIESKLEKLEKDFSIGFENCFDLSTIGIESESDIKKELFLLFKDLKNAKNICKNF